MSSKHGSAKHGSSKRDGSLTVGSLRGLRQLGSSTTGGGLGASGPPEPPIGGARAAARAQTSTALVQIGTELPPSRRGQRCCRTGCAGCPVGEAIRRARAAQS